MAMSLRSSRVCGARPSVRRSVRSVRPASRSSVSVMAWKVTLITPDNQSKTFECSGDDQILGAAEANGMDLPYSCRAGVCATCTARIVDEGTVDQTYGSYLSVNQVADKYVLTCIAVPTSDVTLKTHQAEKVQNDTPNQIMVEKEDANVTA